MSQPFERRSFVSRPPAGPASPFGPAGPGGAQHHQSPTRLTAAIPTSSWPFISDPMSRWNWTTAGRSCAGPPRPSRRKHGWNCRRSCREACTGARPIRLWAGLARPGPARAHFHASRPRHCTPTMLLTTRLGFLDVGKRKNVPFSRSGVSSITERLRFSRERNAQDTGGGWMSGYTAPLGKCRRGFCSRRQPARGRRFPSASPTPPCPASCSVR